MNDKYFDFKEQMRIGNIGESDFIKIYEELKPVKPEKDFRIDFTLGDGKTVELKSDSYDMAKTPNFFMEQFTISSSKNSVGGPWRTKEHNIDYFVYYFMNNKVFFWFNPKPLCEFLDKYIIDYKLKPISIPNKDKNGRFYEALGFKIPRQELKSLIIKEHKIS